jgi:hypothetical protein
MPGRCSARVMCAVSILLLLGSAHAAGSLKDDLAALEGVWVSKAVKDTERKSSGVLKLQFTPAKDGALSGRGSLEIKTKRGGATSSSTRTFTFKLVEQDGKRTIVAPGPSGTGLSLTYRFKGDQLLLSGEVVSRRISYNLQNVALRRPAAK